MRRIGVTATQQPLTGDQFRSAGAVLLSIKQQYPGEFELHHGGCVGGDDALQRIGSEFGMWVVCHRGSTPEKWAECYETNEFRKEKENLERNHNIVDETDELVACPSGNEEIVRSGTWATIRYARKQGKRITYIFPDGGIHVE